MRKYWMMVLAVALGALLIGSSPASASAPCGYAFTAFDWPDPVGDPVEAEYSTVTTTEIKLVKTDGAVGTDATIPDLGVTGSQLTVHYELSGGATLDNGAIRFFAYTSPDANVSGAGQAPNVVAIASAQSGILTLDLAGGAIGTVGFTYDASNASTGTVTFTNLMLDGEQLAFISECPESTPATESPTPSASPTPGASPSPGVTAEPSTAPSTEAGPTLPTTGSSLPVVLGGAAVLLGLTGGGLMALARRRRTTFRAE